MKITKMAGVEALMTSVLVGQGYLKLAGADWEDTMHCRI